MAQIDWKYDQYGDKYYEKNGQRYYEPLLSEGWRYLIQSLLVLFGFISLFTVCPRMIHWLLTDQKSPLEVVGIVVMVLIVPLLICVCDVLTWDGEPGGDDHLGF